MPPRHEHKPQCVPAFDNMFECMGDTSAPAGHTGTLPTPPPMGTRPGRHQLATVRLPARTGRPRWPHHRPLPRRLRGRPVPREMDDTTPQTRAKRPARSPPARLPIRSARTGDLPDSHVAARQHTQSVYARPRSLLGRRQAPAPNADGPDPALAGSPCRFGTRTFGVHCSGVEAQNSPIWALQLSRPGQ